MNYFYAILFIWSLAGMAIISAMIVDSNIKGIGDYGFKRHARKTLKEFIALEVPVLIVTVNMGYNLGIFLMNAYKTYSA